MWKMIATAGLISCLLRTAPAFFKRIDRLRNYPKLNKFLDYTICLITGEVIYTVAFHDIPDDKYYIVMMGICFMTLCIAGIVMWYTSSLAKSFVSGIGFFVLAYWLHLQ